MNKLSFSRRARVLLLACLGAGRTLAAVPSSAEAFEARLNSELGVAGGLTSRELGRRALETSFDIGARQQELLAAAAEADRALLGYLPELTLAASYTRLSDLGTASLGNVVMAPGEPVGALPANAQLVNVPIEIKSILNQYVLQANLLVPVSDYFLRVAPARSAAEHAQCAAASNVEAARSRVLADARVAYYSWVRAKLSVAVAEQALEDAQAHLADSRVAAQAGSASPADVLRLESQVARSELYLVSARSVAAVAEEQVRAALHDAGERVLAIAEDVREPSNDRSQVSQVAHLHELTQQAYQNRPELKALSDNAAASSIRARIERAGYAPRLDALGAATYANPNPRAFPPREEFKGTWQAGVRLSWNITDIASARLRARATEARSAAALSERSALMDRIRVEVRAAVQAVDDSRTALETTQRSQDAAEESYRVRRLSYQNGRATSVELLDAETDLTRARLERLNAEVDARVAQVRLDY
ncbi:MAG TPA: TolC family protein, partial [Polyangiaceae bacterium]|nr:TolC family protein [Polyangiaceae bacterium]